MDLSAQILLNSEPREKTACPAHNIMGIFFMSNIIFRLLCARFFRLRRFCAPTILHARIDFSGNEFRSFGTVLYITEVVFIDFFQKINK